MVYFGLTHSTKTFVTRTLNECFQTHPQLNTVVIQDKFSEKLQKFPAIVIKSASAPAVRVSPDDYVDDVLTDTGTVKCIKAKGTSVVSAQLIATRKFYNLVKAEVFRIDILADNKIKLTRSHPKQIATDVPITPGTTVTELIENVAIEFGATLTEGDYYIMLLLPIGACQARRYGGLFNMEISLTAMSRSTGELEDLADWTIFYLWHVKKKEMEDKYNIFVKEIRHSGEAEFPQVKDSIYTATIDLSLQTQWAVDVECIHYLSELGFNLEELEEDPFDKLPVSILG